MATRKRLIGDGMSTLKLGFNNEVIHSEIQKVIPMLSHKPPRYRVECGAIHDDENERILFKVGLTKNESQVIHGAQCILKVYSINKTNGNESLLFTAPTQGEPSDDGYFRVYVTETDLTQEIQGEFDYVVEVSVKRFIKSFSRRFYFNALGLYDFTLRIKKKVEFLEITKKDFGVP